MSVLDPTDEANGPRVTVHYTPYQSEQMLATEAHERGLIGPRRLMEVQRAHQIAMGVDLDLYP